MSAKRSSEEPRLADSADKSTIVRSIALPAAMFAPKSSERSAIAVGVKASEQCPRTHALIVEAFIEAGLPEGAVTIETQPCHYPI